MQLSGARRASIGVALVALVASGCGGGDSGESGGSGGGGGGSETATMSLGTATTNDIQQAMLERFAEVVAETSDGAITAEVFTGGQLGGNQQMMELVQTGGLEMTLQPSGFMAPFVPEMGVLELPFLFDDEAERDEILADDERMAPFNEAAAAKGLQILFHFSSIEGLQGIASTVPIETADDLSGLKIRVFGAEEQTRAFEAWGASAVPLPLPEVYTALQQGTIDGTAFGYETYGATKMFEVAPYYVETKHATLLLELTISKQWFDGLSSDLQDAVLEAAEQVESEVPELREEYLQMAQKAVEEGGGEVITLSEAELDELREAVQPIREEVEADPVKGKLIESLLG
jgi:C4-dicarboxylate-binding protein DctP